MKSPSEPHVCQCRGDEYLTVTGEFWCETHQCWKTQHYHQLCQTKPGYRQMWEEGRGPGQPTQERIKSGAARVVLGPGDILKKMLGCSAKKWQGYAEMNALGEACQEHLDELSQKLSEFKCPMCGSPDTARRSIELALRKWRTRTGLT